MIAFLISSSILKLPQSLQEHWVWKRRAGNMCAQDFIVPHYPPTFLSSVQLYSQWESELSTAVSWQLLFMFVCQRHTLFEGETPMLPDLLSTVKDPVWLEGRQCSGHSFTVHSLYSSVSKSQTCVLSPLGDILFHSAWGIPAVLQKTNSMIKSVTTVIFCIVK